MTMKLLTLTFLSVHLYKTTGNDCYSAKDGGTSYDGNVSSTVTGAECIPWRSIMGHDDIGKKYLDDNFCRNPDNSSAPWCYKSIDGIVKEYCAVPQCPVECGIDYIACADGSGCIHQRQFCDGINHCKDGSDEKELPSEGVDGIMCNSILSKNTKKCFLREENCCRGRTNSICEGGIDECLCSEKESRTFVPGFIFKRCFRCFTTPHHVIPIQNICDGVINCADLSDEALCGSNYTVPIIWSMKHDNIGLPPTFTCSAFDLDNDTEIDVTLDQICDKKQDCKDNADEERCAGHDHDARNYSCRFENREVTACDGIPQCAIDIHQEECQCEYNPTFCRYVTNGSSANRSYFVCPSNGKRIDGCRVCDAIPDCPNVEDEMECPKRYYCSNGSILHLPMEKKCDQFLDCEDGSDEDKAVCGSELFYCDDEGFEEELQWSRVCDGIQSCSSGADECQPQCINSVFSDVKSLVKDRGVSRLIWVIAVIAVSGNAAVACTNVWTICRKKRSDDGMKVNRLLISSLSLSDLLVGIYVAVVCISSATFEGAYCQSDADWRSGDVCTFIGVLLTIGSEQSVFNMVLITILRIQITWRPLSKPRKSMYLTFILLTWTISVILAIIPILDSHKDFFLREIWYGKGDHYSFQIEQSVVDFKIKWLLLAQNKFKESDKLTQGKWSLFSNLLEVVVPNASATRSFGYYSKHAVCLPNLFVDKSDDSWPYSLMLVLINLAAFIFMFVGYITIYKKATKTNIARPLEVQKKTSSKLQRKLTRILVTDFCCWVPICILCFLQISGVHIDDDVYLPAGLIIIPINSAVNPFLYTDIPEMIWGKVEIIARRIQRSIGPTRRLSPQENDDSHTGERTANSVV